MCNLYSITKGAQAIRDFARAMRDTTGNLPPLPGVFPDQMAPIVRAGPDVRALVMARWGMSGPSQFGGQPVTNIRNVKSPRWRRWLGKGSRCIVPATSFCEYADAKPRKTPIWFALAEDRPLFAFAGLWTPWRAVRGPKSAPVEGEHELFGFLTTEAGRSASSFTQFLTDGARPVCMGPPRRPAPAGAFLAASEPLQDHCSPNPLASAAPPTDGGFFMTTKPARCRCSTSRLATGTRDYGNTKHGEYMCEADATAAGNRAAKNEKHP